MIARLLHHYALLGLPRDATLAELQQAWRHQAAQAHPDANPHALARFHALQDTRLTLLDPAARARYDAALDHAATRTLPTTEGFNGWLTTLRPPATRPPPRGRNRALSLYLSLTEALVGADRELTLDGEAPCDRCNASGLTANALPWVCPICGGRGSVLVHDAWRATWHPCTHCHSRGFEPEPPCPTCSGTGRRPTTLTWPITVPGGSYDGEQLIVRGAGEPGLGEPGDLIVTLRVAPDPRFTRWGRAKARDLDVGVTWWIPFWQAVTGGEFTGIGPRGQTTCELPTNIKDGEIIKLPSLGGNRFAQHGALLVTVRLLWPEALDPQARAALSAWGRGLPPAAFRAPPAPSVRLHDEGPLQSPRDPPQTHGEARDQPQPPPCGEARDQPQPPPRDEARDPPQPPPRDEAHDQPQPPPRDEEPTPP